MLRSLNRVCLGTYRGTRATYLSSGVRMLSDNIVHLDDPEGLEIPKYNLNRNESLEKQKARLLYQSRKRGMLENDLLLSTFAAKYLNDMNEEETKQYDRLINLPSNDWDIYYWVVGHKPVPLEYDNIIMKLLKQHVENKDKSPKLRQPNLY